MDNINQIDKESGQPIGYWDGQHYSNYYKGTFVKDKHGITEFTGYNYFSAQNYLYHATLIKGIQHGLTHLVNGRDEVRLTLYFH